MKKILFVLLCSISSLVNAQALTGFDAFFSQNPIDAHFGAYIANYEYPSLNDKGVLATIGGGVGWRYTFYSNKFMSIAPRVGFGIGYNDKGITSDYDVFSYQVPLSLHLSLGAASSKKCIPQDYKFGFHLGAGYALNGYNLKKDFNGVIENRTTVYIAPIVYTCFKFEVFKDYIAGFEPSISYLNSDFTMAIKFHFDVIFD